MSRQEVVSAWEETVSRELPQLSRPQARVLALWSLGIALAQRCGQTSVAVTLAALLGVREGSMRQRLREWCYAAADKRGAKRRTLAVESCFTPLLGWVLRWWTPDTPTAPTAPTAPNIVNTSAQRLALALDATTLGTRFTVLALCVVYRSSAIPVAWVVVRAATPGAWRPHWERLLAQMAASVPPAWMVLVVADRGLYAPWLFDAITALGWHPGLRLTGGAGARGLYRPVAGGGWRPLRSLLPQPGAAWCGRVYCFREQTVSGTLLARWDAGYAEGWLVLTDLPPACADVAWYGLRAWVEGGFKDLKRDGWQWQRTRMCDPERAARLWLALAVATLWMLSVGGAAEDALPPSQRAALPARHIAHRTATGRSTPRVLSCFRRGIFTLLAAALTSRSLPTAHFVSEPWPTSLHPKTYP